MRDRIPLVMGGQGRTDDEVRATGAQVLSILLALAALALIALGATEVFHG